MNRALVAAFVLATGAGLALQLQTGIADNGDFDRSTGFLLERPEATPARWPPRGTPAWDERFVQHFHDRWLLLDGAPVLGAIYGVSSYKLVLAAQVGLETLVTRDRVFAFSTGSLLTRALLLAALAGLVAAAAAEAPALAAALVALLLAATAVETSFVSFLNGAYEDQVALVLLPALALLVWRAGTRPRAGLAAMAVAAFVGAAKVAFFYLPLLAAPFVWRPLRSRLSPRKAALAVVLAQAVATVPLASSPATRVNAYHAAYRGILLELSPAELADVRIAGAPVIVSCLDVGAFGPRGSACLAAAKVSPLDAPRLALTRPDALVRLAGRAVARGAEVELAYLGKRPPTGTSFADLPLFNFWRAVFRGAGGAVLAAALLATLLALVLARRGGPAAGAARASALLGLFGATQYLVALGDGLVEYAKHVHAGNFANVLSLTLGACAAAVALAPHIESRLKSRSGRWRMTAMIIRQNPGT